MNAMYIIAVAFWLTGLLLCPVGRRRSSGVITVASAVSYSIAIVLFAVFILTY